MFPENFLKRNKALSLIFTAFCFLLIVLIFLPQTVFASAQSEKIMNYAGNDNSRGNIKDYSAANLSVKYDFILIIDESGSMKRNDPSGARKDAAKLFTFLSETLNPGNRVLIAGFGEKTNIYLPLTEIEGNEENISSAINKIQSSQRLTDMKGALTVIKSLMDSRKEKNKTAVIFLTDGSLTLADIPTEEQETGKPKRDITIRSEGEDSGRGVTDTRNKTKPDDLSGSNRDFENTYIYKDSSSTELSYLEKYKADLKQLCYLYRNDGIVIYPIAFTNEADISILKEIASITRGVCYKAEEAKDLWVSFIEILRSITSRFIKVSEATGEPVMSGEIAIGKYIKEMVLISLKNNLSSIPQINLVGPEGIIPDYDSVITEGIFKIVKIKSPEAGTWKYDISGDAVFVYDMFYARLLEPEYLLCLTGAPIALKADMSSLTEEGFESSMADFDVLAKVSGPKGISTEDIILADDGKAPDTEANDGIFTAIYNETGEKGFYTISFDINNKPTGSSASRSVTVEMIKIPVKITFLEPSRNFYIAGKPLEIKAAIEKDPEYTGAFDINNYKLTFNIIGADGSTAKDMALLDNGSASDEKAGDGIYSASFLNTETEGKYLIEFFIRDASEMIPPAYTGQRQELELKNIPAVNIDIKNNLFAGEPVSIAASFEDLSKGIFKYSLKAPDASVSEGILYDDGSKSNNDSSANDGVYSAVLKGPQLIGDYTINIESIYKPGEIDAPVFSEVKFKKEFQVKQAQQKINFEKDSNVAAGKFTIVSRSDALSTLSVDMSAFDSSNLDNKIIKSAKLSGSPAVKPNAESDFSVDFELAGKTRGGQYKISIPLVIDETTKTDIIFDVTVQESFPSYLLGIVVGVSVIGAVAIFLFVYFLYIRPKKRGY